MDWTVLDTWIIVSGILAAVSCALLGNFLILRKMSMMGDAISHAVLPGLAVAFLITGSRASMTMFLGAAIVGVLTAVFTQWISHFGQVEESASMGVVFTSLFAIGLIIIVRGANAVDLDPGCVLYGAIELAPLNTVQLGGAEIPRSALALGAVLLINTLFVIFFFKELRISAFDPELATTLGFSARLMHYMLMTLVAVTTVACFESVGSILVIAMLIVPGAAAHLLTDRLITMVLISVAIAVVCAVGGHLLAITGPEWIGFTDMSTNTAGMMAVVAGALFTLALFGAPRYGLVSRWLHLWTLRISILREDILGVLYRVEEHPGASNVEVSSVLLGDAIGAGALDIRVAVRQLLRGGQLERQGTHFRITGSGREKARGLVRAHRLWENYLVEHLHLAADHIHPTAEQLEHITDTAMQDQLVQDTRRPDRDPHGRDIPPALD